MTDRRKLLIVDDDPHLRKLLKLYLRSSAFDVTEAATGEEAAHLCDSEQFDIVLLDLILPYYGGFRLCQRFKATAHPPHVIIITGDDSEETRASAKECGADDFIAKPFSAEELVQRLRAG